jgi:hypothetical protein
MSAPRSSSFDADKANQNSDSIKILALFGLISAIEFTSIATLIVYWASAKTTARSVMFTIAILPGTRRRRARLNGGEFALITNLMGSMRGGR